MFQNSFLAVGRAGGRVDTAIREDRRDEMAVQLYWQGPDPADDPSRMHKIMIFSFKKEGKGLTKPPISCILGYRKG
jgi:hypothetical protein